MSGFVAGVDFSTKEVHLVRRHAGDVAASWRRITLPDFSKFAERDALAARALIQPMSDQGWWDDVWLVGVEYPYTNPKIMPSVVLKTMLGAIMALIPEHVHVIPMPAQLWTRWFLRGSRIDQPLPKVPPKKADRKPLIKARALALLDSDDIWPQDAYDAFGISYAAEIYNRPALTGGTATG